MDGACVGVQEGERENVEKDKERERERVRERIFVVTRSDRCASNKDFIHAVL